MQQVTVKMVEENEGRENRESAITVAHRTSEAEWNNG